MVNGERFAKVTLVLKKLEWFARSSTVEHQWTTKKILSMVMLRSEATQVDVLAM